MSSITLGFLIDRLIITRLKNHYADNDSKKASTEKQIKNLSIEIDDYMRSAMSGEIAEFTFEQNKVYKQKTIEIGDPSSDMALGGLVSGLVDANLKMWLNQELVYDFVNVPEDQRVEVIDRCATLNIERSKYMDAIDKWFSNKMNSSI